MKVKGKLPIQFFIEPSIKKDLIEGAKKNYRSLSSEIRKVIEDYLQTGKENEKELVGQIFNNVDKGERKNVNS